MEVQLSLSERILFELLYTAMSGKPLITFSFEFADQLAWKDCFDMAKKHGVMALAWDGIQTLPENLLPPRPIKLAWALQVENYEKKYARYVQTLAELRDFYAQHGIALVQLKGVGLSSYYPNPSHREGGDLDIYTYSMDRTVMSDAEANQLADKLMIEQGISVDTESPKHSVFVYHGVPVENHHYFLNEYNIPYAQEMDAYLHEVCNPREEALLDGKYAIPIPSPEFNSLFVPFHAMQHWSAGLCLHHLCDCAAIFNKYGVHLPPAGVDPHFQHALECFAIFANKYLGSTVDIAAIRSNADILAKSENILHKKVCFFCHKFNPFRIYKKWLGAHVTDTEDRIEDQFNLMMHEILRNKYDEEKVSKNFLSVFFFKCRRFAHTLCVRHKVIGISILQAIGTSIYNHIRRPVTIFTFKKK